MEATLSGIRAKIDRAKHHFESLKSALNTWGAKQTEKPVTAYLHPDRNSIEVIEEPETPEVEWALIVGDIAHNLRCALDHLVLQLALLNGSSLKDVEGITSFPICLDGPSFRSSARAFKRCISAEALTALKSLQPYVASREHGVPAERHYLHIVSLLNNIDKHRMLVVLKRALKFEDIAITGEDGMVSKIPIEPDRWIAMEDRTEFGGFDFSPLNSGTPQKMHMDVRVSIQIFIDEPRLVLDAVPLSNLMRNCIVHTAWIVQKMGIEFFGE
jgi:hypothetical protein